VAEPLSNQRGLRIILTGSFNPRILQPAWLAAQKLIRDAESENADIKIVHEEVVAFGLDWVTLQVEHDQLTISSTPKSETPEQVRDLAVGVVEILDHTPIYHVGIDFFGHFALEDQAQRDKLGWSLVPPEPFAGHLDGAGMRSLKMAGRRFGDVDDGDGGLVVRVEPSYNIAPNGVFISVLDQYRVANEDEANVGAGPAISCLKDRWAESLKRADAIVDDLLSAA
jgi:hypothetical protein